MDHHLYDEFDCIMQELIGALDSLMSLMKEEREAIVDFNLEKITHTSRKKNDLLLKIKALESSKGVCTQKIALSLGLKQKQSASIISFIPDQDVAKRLQDRLSCLKSLVQATQELNEVQRQYVVMSLVGVQSSLSVLGKFQADGVCYTKNAELAGKPKASIRGVMDQSF